MAATERRPPHKGLNISRQVFVPSPGPGIGVLGASYYTRPTGGDLISLHQLISRSDTIDVAYVRHSSDNGRTWSAPEERAMRETRPNGTLRRHPRGGFVDPGSGRYVTLWVEGVLPTDNPLEGMKAWTLYYSVAQDGVELVNEQVRQAGFDPLPGVYPGKNCVMMGDLTCRPITLRDGMILVPCQISPLGPDGSYYNPGGGYTYTVCGVVRGRWTGVRLEWELSQLVDCEPGLSTRGMIEPTLAVLDDGRVLMVMRGSNDVKQELPGYRWHSFSSDDGRTWTKPVPWMFANKEKFFSPSSCSQLLAHSSGRLFWLGNIAPGNPRGNGPRYPFVIGEVCRQSGLLKRETVQVIDDRQPGEDEKLTLSNFYAREDRVSQEIVLHMTRLFARPQPGYNWTADALQYRVQP